MPIGLTVVAVVVLVMIGLITFGSRSIRLQRRALTDARTSGLAYLCLPEYGQLGPGMWILTVDSRDVGLRNGWRSKPSSGLSLSKAGATIERCEVRVNAARVVDGLRIAAGDGRKVALAIYPDPSFGVTHPIAAAELNDVIRALRASFE